MEVSAADSNDLTVLSIHPSGHPRIAATAMALETIQKYPIGTWVTIKTQLGDMTQCIETVSMVGSHLTVEFKNPTSGSAEPLKEVVAEIHDEFVRQNTPYHSMVAFSAAQDEWIKVQTKSKFNTVDEFLAAAHDDAAFRLAEKIARDYLK